MLYFFQRTQSIFNFERKVFFNIAYSIFNIVYSKFKSWKLRNGDSCVLSQPGEKTNLEN